MRIAIITGSQHTDSQSRKVGNYLAGVLEKHSVHSDIIDLGESHLPYFDEEHSPASGVEATPLRGSIKTILDQADGCIVVSPERGGMVPGVLKNFFQRCTNKELAHKPTLLVGVSASHGGAYPIAELRMSSYKNTKILYIPDHLIIRDVKSVLNSTTHEGEDLSEHEIIIRDRIEHTIQILLAYTEACMAVRKDPAIMSSKYGFGM